MKVLLIKPPSINFGGSIKKALLPLGIGYLASYLEKYKIDVEVYDTSIDGYYNEKDVGDGLIQFGSSSFEIKKRIKESNPDIVGIHLSLSIYEKCALDVARIVKEVNKDIKVVLGGVHSTFCYKELMKNPNIDIVVLGEGEIALLDIVRNSWSKNGIVQGTPIPNLDNLPMPAYHLFDMEKYFEVNLPQNHFPNAERVGTIITSRGCPNHCIFCSSAVFFGHRIRYRSVRNIKKELDFLIENYNIGEIQFSDDNLTIKKDRAYEIFDLLESYDLPWCTPNGVSVKTVDKSMLQRMKESGCYKTTFAIESGNERVVNKLIKKRINLDYAKEMIKAAKEVGLELHTYFIIGTPGETYEEMEDTFDFIRETKPDSISITLATPLPGTELYKICKKNNYLPKDFRFDNVFQRVSNISTEDFDGDDLDRLQKRMNVELNEYLIKHNPNAKRKYEEFKKRHKEINGKIVFDKI